MAEIEGARAFGGARILLVSAATAAIGWAGLLVGFRVAPAATHFGYLTAFAFVVSIALGGLVFLMTTYLVDASWSVVIRRLNEAVISVFPALTVLFLPVALGVRTLYVWADPNLSLPAPELEVLRHKQAYLNAQFFILRSLLYFVIWSIASVTLRAWSLARDRDRSLEPRSHAKERVFSAAALPFVALALTFAAFDWLMSLDPFWSSSVFGVYYFAGGFVANFGLLSLLAFAAQRSSLGRDLLRPPHFHALGRLMFAFTIFWAYIAFFQALLIRIANRPDEIAFYAERLTRGWDRVSWALIVGRFALPFLALLSQSIKFRPAAMAAVGVWILLGQYLDVSWLVLPVHAGHGPLPTVWDLFALMAVAGSALCYAAWRLRGSAIVPIGDPVLADSIAYRSPL